MRKANWPGEWKVFCAVCGFDYPSGEMQKRWDGQIVCQKDYETRHPADFFRIPRSERGAPPFVRKPPEDVYVEVDYVQEADPPTH